MQSLSCLMPEFGSASGLGTGSGASYIYPITTRMAQRKQEPFLAPPRQLLTHSRFGERQIVNHHLFQ